MVVVCARVGACFLVDVPLACWGYRSEVESEELGHEPVACASGPTSRAIVCSDFEMRVSYQACGGQRVVNLSSPVSTTAVFILLWQGVSYLPYGCYLP